MAIKDLNMFDIVNKSIVLQRKFKIMKNRINKINLPKLDNEVIKTNPIFSINFIRDLNLMHFFQFPRIWYIYHQSIAQSYR